MIYSFCRRILSITEYELVTRGYVKDRHQPTEQVVLEKSKEGWKITCEQGIAFLLADRPIDWKPGDNIRFTMEKVP